MNQFPSRVAWTLWKLNLRVLTKGLIVDRLLETMQQKEILLYFVLFIGNDRLGEHIFEVIMSAASNASLTPVAEVFACPVGQKPSKVEDTAKILRMMQCLAAASEQSTNSEPHIYIELGCAGRLL
ncbi:OLC1v1008631C1 [Oldenlandia corymbosa var. corymbosa]|uniref:OLC1v1008631C1 n=1 Tax=Oldenlandia corymbosa var. corymbosa TaxID=529605 RepID=A0AAV1DM14_OLDCO|nr:OLC1v1008631C1 [Oldenlandia corymbosa var. corymbosa]